MFSSVAHFNQATQTVGAKVKAVVSSIASSDDFGSPCSGWD